MEMERRPQGYVSSGAFVRDEFRGNDFWTKNLKRFVVFAEATMRRRPVPSGSATALDYVLGAVELTLNGDRRCPDDVNPIGFIYGIIRSLISHDYDRYKKRVEGLSITTIPDEDGSIGIDESLVSEPPEIESMIAARELADQFLRSIPERYRRYVELRITQPGRPAAEYAQELNVDLADVRNMDRFLRRQRPRWDEHAKRVLTELPLLPGTVLDSVIGRDGTASAGVKKLRQEIRKELGSSDRGGFVSLGRRGSMNLEPAPLFTCLVTGAVWDRNRARLLADAYRSAGLGKLLTSKQFLQAQSTAAARLQQTLPEVAGSNAMAAAVTTLFDLTTEDRCLHEVAGEMKRITDTVDEQVQELRRIRGTIVRFEDGEALVVLEKNGREQLRELPAALLLSSGLSANGTPFMLHELTFSPDRRAQIALPAIDLEPRPTAAQLRELAAADTPLPRP
jgi:hypothetical protein